MGYDHGDVTAFVYSRHALIRMRDRGISKRDVQECVTMQTFCFPSPDDPRRVRIVSTVRGRKISVVVAPGDHGADVIVTVWSPDEDDES